MIWCLVGDDVQKLDGELSRLKTGYDQIQVLEPPYTLEIIEKVTAAPLFTQKRLVIFRDLFQGKKISNSVTETIAANAGTLDIIFIDYDSKRAKLYKDAFPHARHMTAALPMYVFFFASQVYPGNGVTARKTLARLAHSNQAELGFYFLKSKIRNVLSGQAGKWNIPQARNFYKALWRIEVGLKTSSLPYSLYEALDMLFVTHLTALEKKV